MNKTELFKQIDALKRKSKMNKWIINEMERLSQGNNSEEFIRKLKEINNEICVKGCKDVIKQVMFVSDSQKFYHKFERDISRLISQNTSNLPFKLLMPDAYEDDPLCTTAHNQHKAACFCFNMVNNELYTILTKYEGSCL